MRILVIPSWYPSERNPASGSFIVEQLEALSRHCPEDEFVVFRWGHDDSYLTPTSLRRISQTLKWRCQKRSYLVRRGNVVECFVPTLRWSRFLPFGGTWNLNRAARSALDEISKIFGPVDVIHAHVSYPAGAVALHLYKRRAIPFVVTEHMGPFPFVSLRNRRTGEPIRKIQRVLASSTAVIAVSSFLAREMKKFVEEPIEIIGNTINEKIFLLPHQDPRSDRFQVVSVGSLTDEKGFEELLMAFAQWYERPQHCRLVIAGTGEREHDLKQLAKTLGIGHLVEWRGQLSRSDVADLYRQSHLYVSTSRHESFGITIIEAMAAGLPIIATRSGGPNELVVKSIGCLVDVGDVDAITSSLNQMYRHVSEFHRETIRRQFMDHHSEQRVVEKLRGVYEKCVEIDKQRR